MLRAIPPLASGAAGRSAGAGAFDFPSRNRVADIHPSYRIFRPPANSPGQQAITERTRRTDDVADATAGLQGEKARRLAPLLARATRLRRIVAATHGLRRLQVQITQVVEPPTSRLRRSNACAMTGTGPPASEGITSINSDASGDTCHASPVPAGNRAWFLFNDLS
jgi:hypothetical protein